MTPRAGEQLLDLVASSAGPDRVVAWLEDVMECTTRVADAEDALAELPGPMPPASVLAALADGRQCQPYTHYVDDGAGGVVGVLVAPCGSDPPPRRRKLLWAWRARPWDLADQQTARRAAAAVRALSAPASVAARETASAIGVMSTRVSTLRHFLAGELPQASRAVDALIPGLGAAGAGQIAVLETTADDRAALISDLDRVLRREALVVACTETTTQVVVVRAHEGLDDSVRAAVTRRASRTAGVSLPTPWPRAPSAYGAALAALTSTRNGNQNGDPVVVHDGRAPVVERLGADARLWAAGILAPLSALDPGERAALLHTAGEVMWWGQSAAARVMGWHRRTVARHMDRLADLTGLDLALWAHRVALYTAVRLDALPVPPAVPARRLTLAAALDHEHAREWAAATLMPLTGAQRHAAVEWLASGRQPTRAAAALSIQRSTLYKRLGQISAGTHTPVTAYPGPAADLALALAAVGDLDLDTPVVDVHLDGHEDHLESEVDITRPHLARVYAYCLGSPVHFAADRTAALAVQRSAPDAPAAAQAAHAFRARACEAAAEQGIRQVLSLASGIPTWPAPHHVMQRHHLAARVVYVSADPVVRAHSCRQLYGGPDARTGYVLGALSEGASLWDRVEVSDVLDLAEPILVLHAVTHTPESNHEIQRLLREIIAPLAAGSLLAITCLTADHGPAAARQIVSEVSQTISPIRARTWGQVADLLAGMDIQEPGITAPGYWRPDATTPRTPPARVHTWVALARP